MVSPRTLQTVRALCKPAADAGVIDADELRELTRRAAPRTSIPADTQPPSLLSLAQAAGRLAVSKKTVQRLIAGGTLPVIRLTGSRKSLRVPAAAITDLVASARAEG